MELKEYHQKLLEEFEQEAKSLLKRIPETLTKVLYHYTSFNNLQRIIKNKKICLTDYRHLNDPTEILLSAKVIKKVIQEKTKGNLVEFWKAFLSVFSTIVNEEQFNKEKKNFQNIEKIKSNIYTFSLCEEVDSLPMFRWYADNGTGVSIGFRPEYFDTEVSKGVFLTYIPVNYEKKSFFSLISNLLDIAEDKIKKSRLFLDNNNIYQESVSAEEILPDFLNKLNERLASQLIPLMPGFKHRAYKDEKEHRLYCLEIEIKQNDQDPTYSPNKIPEDRKKIRPRKSKEGPCLPLIDSSISYVESDEFSLDGITEIRVGPCLHFECAKEQIRNLLRSNGYDINKIDTEDGIKIKKSEAPYR